MTLLQTSLEHHEAAMFLTARNVARGAAERVCRGVADGFCGSGTTGRQTVISPDHTRATLSSLQ